MKGPQGLWRAVAAIFVLANIGGGIYAVATGETMHAITHAVLLAAGFLFWQIREARQGDGAEAVTSPQIDSHLDHLQQSVDAIALEVERIGEGQRFAQKVLEEKLASRDKAHGTKQ